MKKILLTLCAIWQVSFSFSQDIHTICKTDKIHQQTLASDPQYKAAYEKTKALLAEKKIKHFKTVQNGLTTEYHIPCVVHVLHTGGAVGTNYNPSDAAIQAFLNHMNEGFSNTNDVSAVPGTYNSINMPIRFYLAQRNELAACSATTGINRIDMSGNATYSASGVGTPGITDAALKAIVHWNDLDYYNIYIVNRIDGKDGYTTSGTFTAGYAYFPVLGGYSLDGMVVLAQQVGVNGSTFIHEMGHSYNLPHPFEGGDATTCPANVDCTTDNDGICDTDPIRLSFTCNPTSGNNPCTGTPWTSSTIQFNYMAYNGCTDRFTAGQGSAMNDVINFIRTGYKNTAAVDAPSGTLPTSITVPTINPTNASNNNNMGPTYFSLNAIEYTSNSFSFEGAGHLAYVDHTCNQATTLIKNVSYPISVKTETNAQKVCVYIDYNNDGTFTNAAPELVFSSQVNSNIDFTHTGNITVPSTGVVFNTPLRMRVIADFISSTITPTMQLNYGQAEDYTVTIMSAALPVHWRNFTATLQADQRAWLNWTTDMESNNDYFTVEHSTDGENYSAISRIPSKGESSLPQSYSYYHDHPTPGINYYRIKQTDADGKFTYSKTNWIALTDNQWDALVFPNPIENQLQISFTLNKDTYVDAIVTDLQGHLVYQLHQPQNSGYHVLPIETQSWANGLYILTLKTAEGMVVKRILK